MITHLFTPTHLAILSVVLLLLFGPRRLPQTGRALGRTLHAFREGIAGQDAAPNHKLATSPPDVAHGQYGCRNDTIKHDRCE